MHTVARVRPELGQEADEIMAEQFLEDLREALNHLYDPDALCSSPLVDLLGISRKWHAGLALQQALIDAIESIKPSGDNFQEHSHLSRGYEVLLHRYVQQWPQTEVAELMGISERQVRREQRAALGLLAQQLASQYQISQELEEQRGDSPSPSPATIMDRELRWLRGCAPPEEPTSLAQSLKSALSMTSSLVTEHDVRLTVDAAASLPGLSVHPVAIREILLSLLSLVICQHPGGDLRVSAQAIDGDVELVLQVPEAATGAGGADGGAGLGIIQELVKISGGELSWTQGKTFSARLLFPAASQVPVLVVDDSRDTLRLFERHALGTRYRILTTSDPEEAMALAEKVEPCLVVLDIMMPQIDGLELLARFRQHPTIGRIPVIVCSVLPNKALAISLGARAFLQKPFRREDLLRTLDLLTPRRASRPG